MVREKKVYIGRVEGNRELASVPEVAGDMPATLLHIRA